MYILLVTLADDNEMVAEQLYYSQNSDNLEKNAYYFYANNTRKIEIMFKGK